MLSTAKSAVLFDTLYINNGISIAFDGTEIPVLAFNSTPLFEQTNTYISLNIGDSLYLTIHNNDSVSHEIKFSHFIGTTTNISAGSQETIPGLYNTMGVVKFYDNKDFPNYKNLGLGSVICVDNFIGPQFVWNIQEFQAYYNSSIVNGIPVDWTTYYPDYFYLNGHKNPEINSDPLARVTGGVGDTIRIYIANLGQSMHSFHFHGYHCQIKYYSRNSNHVERSKDTFPLLSMDSYILELIPDKTGEYPVHDHNLVAVTGGGIYPNGIFLTILIE